MQVFPLSVTYVPSDTGIQISLARLLRGGTGQQGGAWHRGGDCWGGGGGGGGGVLAGGGGRGTRCGSCLGPVTNKK